MKQTFNIFNIFVLIIFPIGSESICNGSSRQSLQMTNITSVTLPMFINLNVSIENSKMSFFFEFFENYEHLSADVEIFVRTPESNSYNSFFKKYFDLCDLLANPALTDPLLSFFYKGFLTSNKRNKLFTKCPIEKVLQMYEQLLCSPLFKVLILI